MSSLPTEAAPWMNNGYFKSILTIHEGHDNFKLREFTVSSGANKGENFAAAIYRVKLNYLLKGEPTETTFILKARSASSAVSEMLDDMGTFEGETHLYANVVPACESSLANFKLAPRYGQRNYAITEVRLISFLFYRNAKQISVR